MPRTRTTRTKPAPRSHRREGARQVNIWVTEEERERWTRAAEQDRRSLSEWIRVALDRVAGRRDEARRPA
jgi:predicted HicB family RNase H-like nuclease